MGGRGTFSIGNKVAYKYEKVGTINGVKVIEKINKNDSVALPEESHSSNAYILLYKDKTFRQYREYNDDHTAKFDIDYHVEYKINKNYEKVYHIHFYKNGARDKLGRKLTQQEYNEYKKYFIGGI